MTKILLVYFSGTGITQYYTSLIQNEFEKAGYICDQVDVEELVDIPTLWQKKPVALNYTIRAEEKRPLSKYPWPYMNVKDSLNNIRENPALGRFINDWQKYDLIGFGSPVYGFRPAPVIIRFLIDLPVFKKDIAAFSYTTHDGAQGDYKQFIRRILVEKGFKYTGHIDQTFVYSAGVVMRNRFNHLKAGKLLSQKSKQARNKVSFHIQYINTDTAQRSYRFSLFKYFVKLLSIPYRFIYSYGINFFLNHFLFGFGIHKELCIQCMTCVNQCPQGLMEVDEEGYPARYYHCMYCLRCLNWCPTDAIYFSRVTDGKARFPGPEVLIEAVRQKELDYRLKK